MGIGHSAPKKLSPEELSDCQPSKHETKNIATLNPKAKGRDCFASREDRRNNFSVKMGMKYVGAYLMAVSASALVRCVWMFCFLVWVLATLFFSCLGFRCSLGVWGSLEIRVECFWWVWRVLGLVCFLGGWVRVLYIRK